MSPECGFIWESRAKYNTVDLRSLAPSRQAANPAAEAGDPRIEVARVEVLVFAVCRPCEVARTPGSNVVQPEAFPASVRSGLRPAAWCALRARSRASGRSGGRRGRFRHGWSDNLDVPGVEQPGAGRRCRGGAGLGREVAHLALDDARLVPATALLGGHGDDLKEEERHHPAAPMRGKTRRGTAHGGGRPAPCAGRRGCRDRSQWCGWRRPSAGVAPDA